MNGPLAKLIPTAVMIAILAYLTWPYIDPQAALPVTSGKLPEIATDSLRPTPPQVTDRDPFGDSVRFEMGAVIDKKTGRINKGAQASAEKTTLASPGAGKSVAGNSAAVETKKEKTGVVVVAPVGSTKEVKTADRAITSDLMLSATMLHGRQGYAIINGQTYRPGDLLDAAGAQAPTMVAEIHHHHVVIERDGSRASLNYPDGSAGAKLSLPGRAGNLKGAKAIGAGAPRGPSAPPRPKNAVRAPASEGTQR